MKAKLAKVLAWALSPQGRLQINHAVTALVAVYIGLHRAGV